MAWRVYVVGNETGGQPEPWGRFEYKMEADEFARDLWYANQADAYSTGAYDPNFDVYVRQEY